VDTRTLQTLAEQLRMVSEGLLQTRAEARAAKVAAQQAKASNVALQKQLNTQNAVIPGNNEFRSRGNAAQYSANASVITDLARALTALEEGESGNVETAIRAGVQSLNGRNKLMRIADNSSVGWAIIEEYQKTEAASDDEDDRRIRNAETAAIAKRKSRNEASRGRGAARGRAGGRGRHHSQYVPYSDSGANHYDQREYRGNVHPRGGRQAPLAQSNYYGNDNASFQQGPANYNQQPSQYYKQPGPCYLCGGPHLMRFCPTNGRRVENVQAQIESQYDSGYDSYDGFNDSYNQYDHYDQA
jgi:hypothetical protein